MLLATVFRVTLDQPLRELPTLPAPRVRQLERAGLETVEDLLTHFPRRYEDRRQFDRFPGQESEQAGVRLRRRHKGRRQAPARPAEAL